jgi:hypothetical protein
MTRHGPWTSPEAPLAWARNQRQDADVEPPIDHRDVTTIMGLLGDIRADVQAIRTLLEEDDGEEEEDPQAHS